MKKLAILLLSTLSAGLNAETSISHSETFISADTSVALAQSTLAHCKRAGFPVAVSVVDSRAQIKAVIVAEGAFPHAIDTSLRKAKTAASRRMPTHIISKENAHEPELALAFHSIGLTSLGGGIPITYQGEVIGGIGVAGAPGEDSEGREHDLTCLEHAFRDSKLEWLSDVYALRD